MGIIADRLPAVCLDSEVITEIVPDGSQHPHGITDNADNGIITISYSVHIVNDCAMYDLTKK